SCSLFPTPLSHHLHSTLFPYTTLFRSSLYCASILAIRPKTGEMVWYYQTVPNDSFDFDASAESVLAELLVDGEMRKVLINAHKKDRKSTRLNSSHLGISYAVFCLKKKT